jgi:hypothetical protein
MGDCGVIFIIETGRPSFAANLLHRASTATLAKYSSPPDRKSEFFGTDVPLETNKGREAWGDEIFGGDLNPADGQVCKVSGRSR